MLVYTISYEKRGRRWRKGTVQQLHKNGVAVKVRFLCNHAKKSNGVAVYWYHIKSNEMLRLPLDQAAVQAATVRRLC